MKMSVGNKVMERSLAIVQRKIDLPVIKGLDGVRFALRSGVRDVHVRDKSNAARILIKGLDLFEPPQEQNVAGLRDALTIYTYIRPMQRCLVSEDCNIRWSQNVVSISVLRKRGIVGTVECGIYRDARATNHQ